LFSDDSEDWLWVTSELSELAMTELELRLDFLQCGAWCLTGLEQRWPERDRLCRDLFLSFSFDLLCSRSMFILPLSLFLLIVLSLYAGVDVTSCH